jgi:hypothetical protein
MSGKKYKGPLPKSKMTKAQRDANNREAGAGRLGEQDQKMMYGGKVKRYEGGGNVISDADAKLLRKTLPSVPGKTISDADAKRLKKILPSESGKSMSNADLEKLKKLMKPANFEGGGEVRGMGRAYQGNKRGCKIR